MISEHKRLRILERDGWKCFWCRRPLTRIDSWEVDPKASHRTKKLDLQARRTAAIRAEANPSNPAYPTIDHVVALANGGDDREFNLVASCHSCNHEKGNCTVDQWAKLKALTDDQWLYAKNAERRILATTYRGNRWEKTNERPAYGTIGWDLD